MSTSFSEQSSDLELVEEHAYYNCVLLDLHGQLKVVNTCWCRLPRIFGLEEYCSEEDRMYLPVPSSDGVFVFTMPSFSEIPNPILSKYFGRQIFGPGIFFSHRKDISNEDVKKYLTS